MINCFWVLELSRRLTAQKLVPPPSIPCLNIYSSPSHLKNMENDFTLVGSYAKVIGSHTIIKVGIQGRLLPFSFSFRHKQTGVSVYNLFQT